MSSFETTGGFGQAFYNMSIVIDGKGHVEGRLAGVVAKQLLNGKKIVVVRAEQIVTNGDHRFNYHKYRRFLHKTTRGEKAFANLKVFEGIPEKYEGVKKLVVPSALRIVTIREDRPVTTLGKLATTFGWKYGEVVKALEEKRLAKHAEHKAYKAEAAKKERAIAEVNKQLGAAAVKFLETYVE